jgi:predicted enzyme related to lactoylglutathione lyase
MQAAGTRQRRSSMATKVIHVEVTGKDGEKLQKFYSDAFRLEPRHQ